MRHSGLFSPRPTQAARKAVGDLDLQARRILLVEDDPAIVSSLKETLLEEGFEVGTAENGYEALERLRSGPRPAAIILDLMMPVMDGWDFRTEQLKDPALRDIPVVVVTAAGFSVDTIRTQFGDVTLVPKPVPLSDLLKAVGRACDFTPSAA